MNLKRELVLLSDKLDRLGLQRDADIIDLAIKVAHERGLIEIFEEEISEDNASEEDS